MMKTGFLENANGEQSSLRLMSVLALGVAALFGAWACATDSQVALYLSMSWMAAAFSAKVGQRAVENSTPAQSSTTTTSTKTSV